MILDTDFLIAVRAGAEAATELAAELETASVPIRIPTMVLEELYVGIEAGETADENARAYEALIENKATVPLNENVARRAGILEGEHLTSDEKPDLGPADAIVAATGLQYSEPVVSADEDFRTVDGLEVVDY